MLSRTVRIRNIKRDCFKVTRLGPGHYSVWLRIERQSFQIHESGFFTDRRHADWTARQGAIALNRFRYGD